MKAVISSMPTYGQYADGLYSLLDIISTNKLYMYQHSWCYLVLVYCHVWSEIVLSTNSLTLSYLGDFKHLN